MTRAFSRLETLDLAENPINYHHNLIALEKMQKLRKVQLTSTFDHFIKTAIYVLPCNMFWKYAEIKFHLDLKVENSLRNLDSFDVIHEF